MQAVLETDLEGLSLRNRRRASGSRPGAMERAASRHESGPVSQTIVRPGKRPRCLAFSFVQPTRYLALLLYRISRRSDDFLFETTIAIRLSACLGYRLCRVNFLYPVLHYH